MQATWRRVSSRVVEAMEEIQDCVVIGQPWDNDVRVILFVVMKKGNNKNIMPKDEYIPNFSCFSLFRYTDRNRYIVGDKKFTAVHATLQSTAARACLFVK